MADDGYVVFSENFVPFHQILHDHAALCIYVPGPTVLASIAKEGSPSCRINLQVQLLYFAIGCRYNASSGSTLDCILG